MFYYCYFLFVFNLTSVHFFAQAYITFENNADSKTNRMVKYYDDDGETHGGELLFLRTFEMNN